MRYIVPDYYTSFQCKCGKCRHSCCDGWPIRISKKEYYQLLGIPCSNKLRAKLDCALKHDTKPNNIGNTMISTDWSGLCMLHREDGLCALQSELKEKSLPEVCRIYPRQTSKFHIQSECSCSNSCEAVIELLLQMQEPMQFIEAELSFDPKFEDKSISNHHNRREECITILQNRNKTLPERFLLIGKYLSGTDYPINISNELNQALPIILDLSNYFDESISIRDYCSTSMGYYFVDRMIAISEEDISLFNQKHREASQHLEKLLCNWEILFEQMFVNHMFFNNFPYMEQESDPSNAFHSLILSYSFLRFHLLGYMSDKENQEEIIDYLSAMFRVIEHSNFRAVALNLYKSYSSPNYISELLYL